MARSQIWPWKMLKRENHSRLNLTNITVMAWVRYKYPDDDYKDKDGKIIDDEKRLEILEKIGGYWLNIRTKNDKVHPMDD